MTGATGPTGSVIDRVWISAEMLSLAAGTAALGLVGPGGGKWTGWSFIDGTAAEGAGGSFMVPSHWATYKLSAVFASAVGTTGSIVVAPVHGEVGDGGTLALTGPAAFTVTPDPTINRIKIAQMYTSVACDPTKLQYAKVTRIGNDGSDNYAAAISLLALIAERVT